MTASKRINLAQDQQRPASADINALPPELLVKVGRLDSFSRRQTQNTVLCDRTLAYSQWQSKIEINETIRRSCSLYMLVSSFAK